MQCSFGLGQSKCGLANHLGALTHWLKTYGLRHVGNLNGFQLPGTVSEHCCCPWQQGSLSGSIKVGGDPKERNVPTILLQTCIQPVPNNFNYSCLHLLGEAAAPSSSQCLFSTAAKSRPGLSSSAFKCCIGMRRLLGVLNA